MNTYDDQDLRAWFRAKAEDYFRAHPGVDPAWYRDLDFTPQEARFMWAVDEGIVYVDASGRFRLPGVNRSTGNPTEPGVFSRPETTPSRHQGAPTKPESYISMACGQIRAGEPRKLWSHADQ